MRVDQVPVPRAVAARPRDERGYPVPAVTPWRDGVPQFAELDARRMFLCAVRERCTVCGLPLGEGPFWRVVDGEHAELTAAALEGAVPVTNAAPAFEGPGHLACMLYSASVCPYLAGPTARRSRTVTIPDLLTLAKGEARGEGGGVVAFDGYRAELLQGRLAYFYGQTVDMIAYERADDLLEPLAEVLQTDSADLPPAPTWLLDDEDATRQAFDAEVQRMKRRAAQPTTAARDDGQERKHRRKTTKISRKRNRGR
jgi:hypothetical protein